jgi:arylsulfatase A-like enzyme
MKRYHFLFILLLISKTPIFAQTYTWTGNGDGVSLYQESNWELNGVSPSQIDPNVAITFNLLIESGNVGGGNFNGALLLGGNSLTISGGVIKGADEITSFSISTDEKSILNAFGGKIICPQLKDLNIFLKNDSEITLSNVDPILGSTIQIDANYTGVITFSNSLISDVRINELSKITVNGEAAIENKNIFLTSSGDGTMIRLSNATGNNDYSDTPIPSKGPNIICILLDDLGYGDLGNFWQNQITGSKKMATPYLDKMANEGAMMTNHYAAAPVCAPSRASFLEGLTQGHSSIRNNQFDKALKNALTLPEMLRKSGYRTMHVGKNGTAGGRSSDLPAHPLKRGFDQFYGYLFHSQGHHHYPQNGTTSKNSYFTDGYTSILEGTDLTYTTDVFTAKSKEWIITHESIRPEQPFFLYLAYDVPHNIMEVPTQAYPSGRGVEGGLQWTSNNSETPWVNTASGTRDSFIHPDYETQNWTTAEKKYATMIRRVDNAVEDIIQTLKDLNIDDETLIVFTSDNGPSKEGQTPTSFQSYANLNGIKRDMWEGGIKMPTICRFPEVIPAGSEITFPSGQWDWLATFAELANVEIPAYTDGVSLLPSMKQDNVNQKDKGYLYHEYYNNGTTPNYDDFDFSKQGRSRNQMQVIRIGDFKGVRYNIQNHTDSFEIYNVVNDPRESINLAATMPELHQKMLDKVLQVRKADNSAKRSYDDELIPAIENVQGSNGLYRKVYQGSREWVPDFRYITPLSESNFSGIYFNIDGNNTGFGVSFTGFLDVPVDGVYTFYLESAAKCHVMLHDIHLLDNDFEFSTDEQLAKFNLKAGKHPIRIFYQQNEILTPMVSLKLEGPQMSKTTIPNSMFLYEDTLSINDDVLASNSNFNIYPQPVIDDLSGTFVSNKAIVYSVSIYSFTGKLVAQFDNGIYVIPGVNKINLETSNLASGLYLLVLNSKTDKIITRKFIKE